MISVDITLGSDPVKTEVEFHAPFVTLVELEAQHIAVIKNFVQGTENQSWLKEANEKVLNNLESFKHGRSNS